MEPDQFHQVVEQALAELPDEFKSNIDNVAIFVEEWPSEYDLASVGMTTGGLLFGLYRGIPKPKRGNNYSSLPDRIVLFSGPLQQISPNEEVLKNRIKETLLHELGHYFGLTEEQIRQAQSR